MGFSAFVPLLLVVSLTAAAALAPEHQPHPQHNPTSPSSPSSTTTTTTTTTGVSSNSVLVALLDSRYTELAELVEKALLLQTLEDAVGRHNVTILAPRNEALDRDLDPDLRRFLLEPRNLRSLQSLLLFHFLPSRIHLPSSPSSISHYPTLAGEPLRLSAAAVTRADDVVRPDGLIHGVDRLLVPRSVQEAFNRRRSLAAISAVLPTGAPEVDPRTHRLTTTKGTASSPLGAPPALPVWDAMAPGPSIAPAPAPGPGSGKHHFDGHSQVKDFIQTLLLYGGYNELADILVNLTSLATEMGRLVSEGYVLTVLAPNDEAMARLTTDQLSEPGSPENILYYHMVPEYQTEESMYNAVRRFGKVRYDTLRLPEKVTAREADGSVKFGAGEGSAYLFDPDIYTDGRISVQGIDAVLFPPAADEGGKTTRSSPAAAPARRVPAVTGGATARPKLRRGKLMEGACRFMGVFVRRSRFASCQ
ncbi:hypothetical protein HU200_028135 [Digitaria exilis]|uniref:FAS1 domain-containing protein n=1 Tax=Digitaria exilis TaxID=1010633 RepID=A0A835C100_9POAL|nr:hypothetical protein HU200_028135 [Digitaria exilis]